MLSEVSPRNAGKELYMSVDTMPSSFRGADQFAILNFHRQQLGFVESSRMMAAEELVLSKTQQENAPKIIEKFTRLLQVTTAAVILVKYIFAFPLTKCLNLTMHILCCNLVGVDIWISKHSGRWTVRIQQATKF